MLSALCGAACLGVNDTEPPTVWETELTPEVDYPGLSGQVAAISKLDGTSVGIGIDGAEPAAEHPWALRLGSCSDPGTQIGPDSDYPVLQVGMSGTAEAETQLGTRLYLDNAYHVEVRLSASDRSRIACGDLAGR